MNNFKTILMTSVLTTLAAGNVYAAEEIKPSFDCTKAKTRVEKLICSDAELAKLDREMSEKYDAMYKQMKTEYPIENGKYGAGFPTEMVRRQKEWIKTRNGMKSIEALKRTYREQISVIESHEYLKGCFASTGNLEANGKNYNSPLDFYFCREAQHYFTKLSVLLSLYNKPTMEEKLHQAINERMEFQRKVQGKFSKEELDNLNQLFKKNPLDAMTIVYKKTEKDVEIFYKTKFDGIKEKVDNLFSNACDFYFSTQSGYGGLLGASYEAYYQEPDGKYNVSYVGTSHSCAFYTYNKVAGEVSKSIETPTLKGDCYPHNGSIIFKGTDYVKLAAKNVTDDLKGASYALYRFDPKTVQFIYDCTIKE